MRLYETNDRLTLAARMPGFGPEDIGVEVRADGHLVIDARLCEMEACGALKSPSKDVLLDEWSLAPLHRDLPLPNPVDGEGGTATYGNGVLVVSLPRTVATRPARLRLTPLGEAHGVGGVTHPVR